MRSSLERGPQKMSNFSGRALGGIFPSVLSKREIIENSCTHAFLRALPLLTPAARHWYQLHFSCRAFDALEQSTCSTNEHSIGIFVIASFRRRHKHGERAAPNKLGEPAAPNFRQEGRNSGIWTQRREPAAPKSFFQQLLPTS